MPRSSSRSDLISWLLGVLVVGGAIAAVVVSVMFLSGRQQTTTPTARLANPTLARALGLREAPRADGSIVATLPTGTHLRLLGRLADGSWLFASPVEQIAVAGWVPVEAVREAGDIATLAVIDATTGEVAVGAPGRAEPVASARAGVGAPDLVLQSVGAQQDRLAIVVRNIGSGDLNDAIIVTIDGGTPRRIDVGKPLRPGESLQAVLNTEYVQRRARVAVAVSTGGDATPDNNRQDAVVDPDEPLDLELQSAAPDPRDGHLVVTLRAHSPIPLVGTVSISVRESPPSNRLIASTEAPLDIAAEGTQRFDVAEAIRVDLTRVTVSIATAAIADANPVNDSYPR